MHNVSSEFLESIKQSSRNFESKVIIRDKEYDDDVIIDMIQEEMVNPGDDFTLGSVASTKLEITILETDEMFENAEVKPYIGLDIDEAIEYVPLGVFTVDEVKKQNKTVKLTCFDNMIKLERVYFSNLSYPSTLQSVAEEICEKAGVVFNSTLPNYKIDKIEGYSLREAIGFVASACGGFARFNKLGQLEIQFYTDTDVIITPDNFVTFETAGKEYKINKVTAVKGEEKLSKGNKTEFGREIVFENPVITDEILTSIYNKLNGFSYMPYTLQWQGNPALQAGDMIKVIDLKGYEYNTLVMRQKINYKGGLSADTKAVGKSEQGNTFDSKGSMTNKVERYSIEQANIKRALIEKASIDDLEVVNAKIENALIDKLDVIEFNAKIGVIETSLIGKAEIKDLHALQGEFNTLKTVDLEVVRGHVDDLSASVADINTLVNGNLTSENMQSNFITATSGVIANAAITNAMIKNVNIEKLNAGDISTTKFRVVSDSGNLRIQDNTLKVWDDTGKERISLGLNGTDYDLLVRGKDGQTVLFGSDGVTNAGITKGAVDDSKVADNANISGGKLNIASVVQSINEGDTLIESTNISLDRQKLNVAFGTLKTQTNEVESKTDVLITDFTTVIGKITTLISDVETIEGEVNSTKSNVSSLSQTVNSMKSSISSLETENQTIKDDVSGLSTEINTTQSNLVQFKQNLDGFKTTVHDTYATKQSVTDTNTKVNTLNEKTSTMESNIVQNRADISIKVSQTDVEKLINEIEIGGRNLLKNSSLVNDAGLFEPNQNVTLSNPNNEFLRVYSNQDSSTPGIIIRPFSLDEGTYTVSFDARGFGGVNEIVVEVLGDSKFESVTNEFERISVTLTPNFRRNYFFIAIRSKYIGEGFEIKNVKLEKGTKATDWTPAPEDFESEITTINSKVAEININLGSISSRVSSAETNITSINGEVSSLQSRVSTAEQKITPNAIVNTVRNSTGYKGDINALDTKILTVEQTAESYKISIDNMKIGGRNLILGSSEKKKSTVYKVASYELTEDWEVGEEYTVTIKGSNNGGQQFGVWRARSSPRFTLLDYDPKRKLWVGTAKATETSEDKKNVLTVYNYPSSGAKEAHIQWIKLEKGNRSTDWTPAEGELTGATYTFDGKNAVFKGAGLKIQNQAGTDVLWGNTSGDLSFVGDLTTYNNNQKAVEISRNSMRFYDWEGTTRKNPVGKIYTSRQGSNPTMPGIAIGHDKGGHISLVYEGSNTYYAYMDFDKDKTLTSANDYPIRTREWMLFNKRARFNYSAYFGPNNQIFNSTNNTLVCRVNGANHTGFSMDTNKGLPIMSCSGGDKWYMSVSRSTLFNTRVHVNKDFSVTGKKNAVHETKNYGKRLINAYETAGYYFGDIGSGKIGEDGLLYIYICDILDETVNTHVNYHITYGKCGKGDVYTKEKHKNYFVVEGTPGLWFSWELKAKRNGYEYDRLEVPGSIEEDEEERAKDEELKKIVEDECDFDLAKYVLGGDIA